MSYQPYREKMFVVTSSKFQGDLVFVYDGLGNLRQFKDLTNMNEVQQKYLRDHFPFTSFLLPELAGDSRTLRVEEVKKDLSFRAFWNQYDHKVGDRKRAERLWNQLREADRLKALQAIPRYRAYLDRTRTKIAHPETWLAQERWKNEL